MKIQTIPVLLLTGYLGSGKTTLLNRILNNRKGIKFAVIVNDIGEVNIDADLIQAGGVVDQKDDSLVALQNGCICCTLKTDLIEQLLSVARTRKFDYIVIEASGICEPAPIAQTICQIPGYVASMSEDGVLADGEIIPRLDCIVTVVDALRMKDEWQGGLDLMRQDIDAEDIENLVIQQIEFCNLVLLNKADMVTAEELGRTKQIIRTLQQKAEIVECNYGDVDFDKILDTYLFDFEKVATSATWVREVEGIEDDDESTTDSHEDEEHEHEHHHHHDDDDDEEHEHHHEHEHEHEHPEGCTCGHCHHHHHHHDEGEAEEYGIGTFVYRARRPFNLGRFDDFVARQWPKSVIRCKGMCYFSDERDICYVFEQAGKQVNMRNAGQWFCTMPKDELEEFMLKNPGILKDWDEDFGDRMQKLVFIGQKMDKKAITEALDRCLVD